MANVRTQCLNILVDEKYGLKISFDKYLHAWKQLHQLSIVHFLRNLCKSLYLCPLYLLVTNWCNPQQLMLTNLPKLQYMEQQSLPFRQSKPQWWQGMQQPTRSRQLIKTIIMIKNFFEKIYLHFPDQILHVLLLHQQYSLPREMHHNMSPHLSLIQQLFEHNSSSQCPKILSRLLMMIPCKFCRTQQYKELELPSSVDPAAHCPASYK